jgi:hypothetical protein
MKMKECFNCSGGMIFLQIASAQNRRLSTKYRFTDVGVTRTSMKRYFVSYRVHAWVRLSGTKTKTAGTMIAAESDDPVQIDRILDGFQGLV